MSYMSKKTQKRQTTIISLSDRNQQEIKDINEQKEQLLKDFEQKKEGTYLTITLRVRFKAVNESNKNK